MDVNNAKELVKILQDKGWEAELYENYSGRGMYGKTTTGVTTDARPNTMDALSEQGGELEDWDYRTDSMGLDYIYY